MKKLLLFFSFILPSIVFLSCNEEEEPVGDRNPVQIFFFVEDAEGNDLLDPENPNAFGPEDITITCTERIGWNSQTYHVGAFNGSNYIWPGFQVSTLQYNFINQYIILIGDYYSQYLASMPIKNIEIEWPDGSKDYIVLTYSEHRSGNRPLQQNVHIFLNGVEMPYPYPFTIVK